MEKTPKPHTSDKTQIFRIVVAILAALALLAAILYMIRGIVLDVNATNRLLAEAFLSYQSETTVTPDSTSPPNDTTDDIQAVKPLSLAIVSAKLSEGKAAISNYTSYSVDEEALLAHEFDLYAYSSSPLVLIVHGHKEESYAPKGTSAVDADYPFTNSNPSENIFAVGEAVAEILTASGIRVIHPSDEESDIDRLIQKYLAEYPSIRFVLDIHRDGLYTEDQRIVRSDGQVAGTPSAELMLAVGTATQGGASSWQENLAAAYRLSSMITSAEKNIMRPILLRPEGLSQQYAPCSLSLYVGTTGNTLTEALTAARFFARYYAIFILSAVTL